MISIGGVVKNNETFTDPWANGLGIFDMTTLTWGSSYDAKVGDEFLSHGDVILDLPHVKLYVRPNGR